MPLPDYERASIVNLMSSVLSELGDGSSDYPPCVDLGADELRESKQVVLFVVDGLGYEYLRARAPWSLLAAHLRTRLTSVFPSTTASAITTFLTGEAPQEHGLTGWFTWLDQAGAVIATLPFRPRAGEVSCEEMGIDPRSVFDRVSVFERLSRSSAIVLPEDIVDSSYTRALGEGAARYGYDSLEALVGRVAGLVRGRERVGYVYAYWPEFDALCHQHGASSAEVDAHFATLDAAFGRLLEAVAGTGTTVIVTADHGFIDTEPASRLHLDAHPALAGTLARPLCGEPRVAYCYVRPDAHAHFEQYVNENLRTQATLWRSEALIEQGYFGRGERHPRLRERVGDYTLLMRDNHTLTDSLPNESRFVHVGAHGGLSAAEMYVPLVAVHA